MYYICIAPLQRSGGIKNQQTMKIEPFKMEVTPEQSRQVQEIVFRNGGGSWANGGPVIKNTEHPYLSYDSDKDMQFVRRENRSHFDDDRSGPLITFAEFMARYGGAQTTQFDIMRKIVTIAEEAHKNGDTELCGILLGALSDYVIHNRPYSGQKTNKK